MTDQFKYVQAQPFSLSGSGAIAGATSVILKSFAQIDGTALTMTDFGSIGFGTLEPGNGTLEEQISFTGITQNDSGTATLTGVSSVAMISPYTATSGLSQTHAGSTTFVISNTAGFYDRLTGKADDETISGTWTFTSPNYPRMDTATPYPVDNEQFATKAYADSLTFAGAPDATTTQKGIVELATQAEVDAKTATGGTGASLVPTPALARSTLLSDYVADTGAADAYAIAPSPAITAYTTGQIFTWKSTHTNTTTSTLNVNGLGVKTIKKKDGATNLVAGDIVNGQVVQVEYDGTNFQMMSPVANGLPAVSAGSINQFLGTTDGATLSFQRPFDYQSFTGSGTWTKPTNLSGNEMVLVQTWGGGGGGGGAANASTTSGGGGGGGAFTQEWYRASDLGSTVSVTIGAGGSGGSAGDNDGTSGGNTTFGALVTAFGGVLGRKGSVATGGTGGASGPGVGTAVFAGGVAGADGLNAGAQSAYGGGGGGGGTASGSAGAGGAGAAAYFGGGGGGGGAINGAAGAGGAAKTGYGGAGGNGGSNSAGVASAALAGGGGGGGTNAGAARAGGAGFRGECRVWTFY